MSARLVVVERQLAAVRDAIARHGSAFAYVDAREELVRASVSRRAAALYMVDAIALTIPRDAAGPNDFLDRMRYMEAIQSSERALIEEVQVLRRNAVARSEQLNRQQTRAFTERARLVDQQYSLAVRVDELSRLKGFLDTLDPKGRLRTQRGGVRGLVCPVVGALDVFDDFGFPRPGGPHQGVDIKAYVGTPVRAVLPGVVAATPTGGWWGIGVILRDVLGNEWWYAHLSSLNVRPGERVTPGDLLGRVGCTGTCYGPHLHFEYRPKGGRAVDPYILASNIC